MFDLEKAIREWKKDFQKQESFEDGFLADIELLLRDAHNSYRRDGMAEDEAFRAAVAQVGTASSIASEYRKNQLVGLDRRAPFRLSRFMPDLLWNYAKIAVRKIRTQKGYAAISIGSLALGMAIALLTLVWVQYETSYDRFHGNSASIYRLLYSSQKFGQTMIFVPSALPSVIGKAFPEVEASARVLQAPAGTRFESPRLVDFQSRIAFVDADFLSMFDFPLLAGDRRTALKNPRSVLLTAATARKFFGPDDPVGKTLLARDARIPLMVAGVLKDIPETSHLDFDVLLATADAPLWDIETPSVDDWSSVQAPLYVQLTPRADPAALEGKLNRLLAERLPLDSAKLSLQPLRDIHLRSDGVDTRGLSGRRRVAVAMRQIWIFLSVALAVLLMGGINYVNLAAARSLKRAKEIGIRKVNGARKSDIVRQFLGESVLFAFIALAVAVLLGLSIGLPLLRRMSGLAFDTSLLPVGRLVLEFVGLALVTGLAAGFYPALLVSSFSPARALKEALGPGRRPLVRFRRLLVAAQIACAAILISVIAVLLLQLRYIDRKDLGFDRANLVVVRNDIPRDRLSAFKADLLSDPVVRGAATGFLPLMGAAGHMIQGANLWWEGKSPESQVLMDWHFVDEDYQKTYGLEMLEGRFFSREFPSDRSNFVLNESAVKAMGLKDPVGKLFKTPSRSGRIIGVVKDFHVGTLKAEIRPMYFAYASGYFGLTVQIDPRHAEAAMKHIAAVVKKYDPERPLAFRSLDDYLRQMYAVERLSARIVAVFGVVSVLIACLGLFGLISFMAEQRTKEIGIRKVLGASAFRIVGMMSAEFAALVGLAVLAAAPVGGFIASRWIGGFAYRIGLSWWIFAGTGVLVFVLALAAVCLKTVRAAGANPVESLRYE